MPFDPPRELTDPKAMRALAHPVRLALLEALADAGTLTATEAGELVGESPANASFHLRQLAKYGYVVEAEGATGRKRPWKLKDLGMRWTDVHEDAEVAGAARALQHVVQGRYFERAQHALDERHAMPEAWRAVTGINQMRLYLTPAELKALDDEIVDLLLNKYADRRMVSDDQPADAERVEILTLAYRVP
jgi:DNA-binding transcriptional ArsR family regulator